MPNTLLLLHTEPGGGLGRAALEALTTAQALGEFSVGLVGATTDAAAASIGGCGATRWLAVSGDAFGVPRYSTDAAATEALCRAAGVEVILAPCTPRWQRALPGVAQRLGGRVDTHITALERDGAGLLATRWYYRQRIEGQFTRSERPWLLLLDGGEEAWTGAAGAPAVETVEVAVDPGLLRTSVVGTQAVSAGEQTIRPDAALLFVAGAGWTKKQRDGQTHTAEAAALIAEFVRRTQCSLGSSKSLVDQSGEGQAVLPFLTHLHQVGQTGSTPRHRKGLATCCHGEEPHVVGWRFIGERRAVNLDAGCGWARGKADVLYVADAFEVVRELLKAMGG